MNSDNLTPFNRMSPERQREIARMGGKASGAARRRKAYQRRTLSFLLRVCAEHGANSERSPARGNGEQSKGPPGQEKRGSKA